MSHMLKIALLLIALLAMCVLFIQPTLAGEEITDIFTNASGNNQAIGGLKVVTKNGWFAARPSGTEDIYKIYAESFISKEYLATIQEEAKAIVLSIF